MNYTFIEYLSTKSLYLINFKQPYLRDFLRINDQDSFFSRGSG